MERAKYIGEDAAKKDLGIAQTKPAWLQNQHSLPFQFLSDDEFEIFCYLLLCKENPEDKIFYYGKTGDAGRDIVRIEQDGTVELIQCKRYQNNVGIGEIRTEIAKLYVNLHNRIIAEKPHRVIFYVVPDLTAPAQDLISQDSKWIEIAENALKEHLKKEPNKELLDFALSWYPGFFKQTAIDLTQRAWQQKNLVEEFFEYKKVIDPDDSKLNEILNILKTGNLNLQPTIENPASPLCKLLQKAEEENPGLSFTASLDTQENVTFTIAPKPCVGKLIAGSLSFPNTEAGERGKQKFKLLIEQGYDIKLENDEFEWEYGFKLPEFKPSSLMSRTLSLCSVPKYKIPIRVEILLHEKIVALFNLTYLSFIRAGTHEMESHIEGGQLAGKVIIITSNREKGKNAFSYSGDTTSLHSVKAVYAKASLDAAFALLQGGKLRITLLEEPDLVVTLGGNGYAGKPEIEEKYFREIQEFLESLIKINQKFGINLRCPEILDAQTVKTAKIIVASIENREIEYPKGTYSFPCEREDLLRLLEWLKNAAFQTKELPVLSLDKQEEYQLLGHLLPIAETQIVFKNVTFVKSITELEKAVEALSESDIIKIKFRYERAIQTFLNWLPKATD